MFSEHNLSWKSENYSFHYNSNVNRNRFSCKNEDFSIERRSPERAYDSCYLCTIHHPFLNASDYIKEEWRFAEEAKAMFMEKAYEEGQLLSFIAIIKMNQQVLSKRLDYHLLQVWVFPFLNLIRMA